MRLGGFEVDFLIVGAQKSGTTALASFLSKHSDICFAPVKEAHFFDDPDAGGLDWAGIEAARRYREFFPNYSGQRRSGEASPSYMFLAGVPERILRYNPTMKLIAILREPSERAVSHHEHSRRLGHERLPLGVALLIESARLRRDRDDKAWDSSHRRHSYVHRGRYAVQLRRLLELTSERQLLVLRTEELADDHEGSLKRVFAFLELDPPPAMPASERIHSFPRRFRAPSWAERWVARRCLASTTDLERLLGWDLTTWKERARR